MPQQPLRIALVFSYSLAYCRAILRGVTRYAQTKNDWAFTPIEPDAAGLRLLREVRPAGLIAHVYSADLARALTALRRPTVNVCGVLPAARFPRVGLDDAAIGRAAAAHLLDRGLRHFAFVGHPDHAYSVAREAAFRAAVRRAGFKVDAYHEPGGFDPRGRLWSLDDALRRWVLALPKPVGLFTCNDVWGAQLSEACRRAGAAVPEDVAIVGVDNDDLLCELARPPLSSVAVPAEAIGHRAAALLDRLMVARRVPAPTRRPILLPPAGVVARRSSDVLAIADPLVAETIRTIRQAAHRPLSAGEAADVLAVSRRSLERRFRRALGRGIAQEIRRVHVERAKTLLLSTDLPMSQIAAQAGFSDGKHLSVSFRHHTGTTPSAYRSRARG